MNKIIQVESHAGKTIKFNETRITPFSQTLHVQIPFSNGGLIWNRPKSILVVGADRTESIIPVRDFTRQAIWMFVGITFLVWLLTRKVTP